jgi:hypothetical protein
MVPPWLGTLADNKVWNGHMIVANVSASGEEVTQKTQTGRTETGTNGAADIASAFHVVNKIVLRGVIGTVIPDSGPFISD